MRGVKVVAIAAAGAALLAACTSSGDKGESSSARTGTHSSGPPVPTGRPDFDQQLRRGDAPQNPIAAFGSLWIAAHHAGTVVRLKLTNGRIQARIRVGAMPGGIVSSAGLIWVTRYGDKPALAAINPRTNKVVHRLRLPGESCCQPAVIGSTVWVTAAPDIVAVDARTASIGVRVRNVESPVAFGGRLWAMRDGKPVDINVRTGAVRKLGPPSTYLLWAGAISQGLAWAWDGKTIIGLRPSGRLGRTVSVPIPAVNLTNDGMVVASGKVVWGAIGHNLVRVSPGAKEAVLVAQRDGLLSVAGDGKGGVWLTTFESGAVEHFADS